MIATESRPASLLGLMHAPGFSDAHVGRQLCITVCAVSFVTALASEERGNVIARVCMSVCMCVTKCATNINSPRRCGTMGFYLAKHHVIGIVLDVTMVAMIAICCVVTLVEAMN
jgi:hypothetical protein